MKIEQVVFDFHGTRQKLSEQEALKKGMEAKAIEFVKRGAGFYRQV